MEILLILILTAGVCLYIGHETSAANKKKSEFADTINTPAQHQVLVEKHFKIKGLTPKRIERLKCIGKNPHDIFSDGN